MRDKVEPMSLSDGSERREGSDVITKIGNVVSSEQGMFTPGRRLCLDAEGKVVEGDDPNRLTLLCSETGSIPMERARELGLLDEEPEQKAIAAPPENKAVTMPKGTKKRGKK